MVSRTIYLTLRIPSRTRNPSAPIAFLIRKSATSSFLTRTRARTRPLTWRIMFTTAWRAAISIPVFATKNRSLVLINGEDSSIHHHDLDLAPRDNFHQGLCDYPDLCGPVHHDLRDPLCHGLWHHNFVLCHGDVVALTACPFLDPASARYYRSWTSIVTVVGSFICPDSFVGWRD
ncbi:hypothetical protein BDZ45DRAFT_432188 [Acephala macrosclerotiorum]|nr:hypothetical protein BDZ45DRAFT_432188 [Acephala macrosclerotiorum]